MSNCGGGGSDAITAPPTPPATETSIELSESAVTIEMGFSRILSATVKTSNGAPVPGAQITWSSDNPAVAEVIGGSINPVSPGVARVTASASGKSASAVVTVIPTVVISIGLSRTTVTLAPGATTVLTATPLDAIGRPIPGRVAALSSSDAAVVTAGATGVLTAKVAGSAYITASLDNKFAIASVLVTPPVQISIATTGVPPQGLAALHTYSVTLRDDSDSLTTVSADGSPIVLAGQIPLADSVEFVAQADSASGSNWVSRLSFVNRSLPAAVGVVFVPKILAIRAGTFAGTPVNISVDNAVVPCSTPGGACQNGFYGAQFRTGVTAWSSLPIGVQLTGFSSSDSATMWVALRAMNDALGRTFFVPDDGRALQLITVGIGLPPEGAGSLGYTTWHWDVAHRMTDAHIGFVSTTPAANLVQHEFMHALGFGHTCSWSTVMGGYGCPMAGGLSASDVAYVNLAYAVFETEKTFRLPDGALRCGTMSLWNAALSRRSSVACSGDRPAFSISGMDRLSLDATPIGGTGAR